MKAWYCKCKNTYTTKDCDYEKKCNAPAYWGQGIGSLTGNGTSNIDNQSTSRTKSSSNDGSWD